MERVPTHAQVQHKARRDTVVILQEKTAESAAPLRVFTAALNKAIDEAGHEVRTRIAAVTGPAEAELAVLAESIDEVHLHLHQVATDGYLVFTANPMETV